MPDQNEVSVSLGVTQLSCFVLMPFSAVYDVLYEKVMRPAVEAAGLECVRADEVFTKPQVTHEIWSQLRSCRMVLAELTGKNPNVLYELGLAHAIGKPSVTITRDESDVPLDLRALRYLVYDTSNPFWGDDLRTSLTTLLKAILAESKYDAVFDGITSNAVFPAAVPPPPAKRRGPVPANVSGLWIGEAPFPSSDFWSLGLDQEGSVVTGTLTASGLGDKSYVVLQNVTGDVRGNRIRVRAVSHSVLSGDPGVWHLDEFEGALTSDGLVLEGAAPDSHRVSVPIRLTRHDAIPEVGLGISTAPARSATAARRTPRRTASVPRKR